MYRYKLRNLLFAIFVLGFFVTGCQPKDISITSKESSLSSLIPSATLSPTPKSTSTFAPSQTPSPSCVDIEISAPMTDSQVKYLESHTYNFLYAKNEKNVNSIYSVNRADIVCSQYQGSTSGNFDVWKVVSGFIIDINQPNKDLYYPGGTNSGGGNFVNIYAKARFISQDGTEHDYWLQLQGNPPGYWFQLVQWDKSIAESKKQSEITAMDIFLSGKNGDGTSSYIDANTMIPNSLLKVNDQFIAIIYVGYTTKDEGFMTTDITKQFINAIEGKTEFPITSDGYFLPVQAIIVPSRP